jgi:dTDP-4-amino-4,6-dideoxygalactose transaminase
MNWRVPLADLDYGPAENQAVLDVLNSRWLTMGAVTQEFERQFAQSVGAKHAFGVSNATVALHLACVALGIGAGDEVIVPSLSFVATSNAVLYTGAQVRFADILGADELTIDPQEIERLVTPQTRAVIVMHYAGFPCHMPEILDIAARHNLAVIEDAAHAPGACLDGRPLGTWGEVGCFSFFSNKNLSTGEGGMLVTNREDIADKLRVLRSHGMTSLTWDRHQGHAHSYDVVDLGYNYRIDEIHSALGLVQLGKLSANNARRQQITEKYWNALKDSPLELPFQAWAQTVGVAAAYHIFPVLLPEHVDRRGFMDSLRLDGVQTSVHYPSIHTFSYYLQRFPGIRLPKTEDIASREVTLPLYPALDDQAFEIVIQAIHKVL